MKSTDMQFSLSASYEKEYLRVMYYTGQDTVTPGKEHIYREGVKTKAGNLELSEWKALVLALIEQNGEQDKLEQMKAEARKLPWLHTENDLLQTALEMYCRD